MCVCVDMCDVPGCDALPTCHSCMRNTPPLSFTACTTGFQAATCREQHIGASLTLFQESPTVDASAKGPVYDDAVRQLMHGHNCWAAGGL